MYLFFESIRVINGRVMNLKYHQDRVNRTCTAYQLFQHNLKQIIRKSSVVIPNQGLFKLRIAYASEKQDWNVTCTAYKEKAIQSLQLIHANSISYTHKSEDRKSLQQAFEQRGTADDILIVQNGYLTDTSYCSIALYDGTKWFTPAQPLLAGTMRAKLLDRGIIHERDIHYTKLSNYSKIRLFNALIPWSSYKDVEMKRVIE